MMGYIIISRNPNTKDLSTVFKGEDRDIRVFEFEDQNEAFAYAEKSRMCQGWGYQILRVE